MFTKEETTNLVISILILGFIFGFDDGNPTFIFGNWLANFFKVVFLVAIALLFRELVLKWVAKGHDALSYYDLWSVKQTWIGEKLSRGYPLGAIIGILISIFSKGKFFFTAVGKHTFIENRLARVGRKYANLQFKEEARIAASGILASLFISILALLLGNIFNINVNAFITINFYLALFNLIPVSELDGAKIFFGSLLTYIFLLVFVVAAFLIIKTSIIFGVLAAFLIASLATLIYYYKWGVK